MRSKAEWYQLSWNLKNWIEHGISKFYLLGNKDCSTKPPSTDPAGISRFKSRRLSQVNIHADTDGGQSVTKSWADQSETWHESYKDTWHLHDWIVLISLTGTDQHRCLLPLDIIIQVGDTKNGKEGRSDSRNKLRHEDVYHWTLIDIKNICCNTRVSKNNGTFLPIAWLTVHSSLGSMVGSTDSGDVEQTSRLRVTKHHSSELLSTMF